MQDRSKPTAFITVSMEGDMRAEVVMKMSGHTNYQTFKQYIKITDTVKGWKRSVRGAASRRRQRL